MSSFDKRSVGRPRLSDSSQQAAQTSIAIRSDVREGREESRDAIIGREERVPLGIVRQKLKTPSITGFRLRWINDEPGRIHAARQGGYDFVLADEIDGKFGDTDIDQTNRDLGSKVSRAVSKTTGLRAFLMKIPNDLYEADQRAKERAIQEVDDAIHSGKLKNFVNQYVPERGIQIRATDERI